MYQCFFSFHPNCVLGLVTVAAGWPCMLSNALKVPCVLAGSLCVSLSVFLKSTEKRAKCCSGESQFSDRRTSEERGFPRQFSHKLSFTVFLLVPMRHVTRYGTHKRGHG